MRQQSAGVCDSVISSEGRLGMRQGHAPGRRHIKGRGDEGNSCGPPRRRWKRREREREGREEEEEEEKGGRKRLGEGEKEGVDVVKTTLAC